MNKDKDLAELLEDIQDAEAELRRYRQMLRNLGAGIALGIMLVLTIIPMMMANLPGAAIAAVTWIGALITLICVVLCIAAVCNANDARGAHHPAVKLRAAQRAHRRVVMRDGADQ